MDQKWKIQIRTQTYLQFNMLSPGYSSCLPLSTENCLLISVNFGSGFGRTRKKGSTPPLIKIRRRLFWFQTTGGEANIPSLFYSPCLLLFTLLPPACFWQFLPVHALRSQASFFVCCWLLYLLLFSPLSLPFSFRLSFISFPLYCLPFYALYAAAFWRV